MPRRKSLDEPQSPPPLDVQRVARRWLLQIVALVVVIAIALTGLILFARHVREQMRDDAASRPPLPILNAVRRLHWTMPNFSNKCSITANCPSGCLFLRMVLPTASRRDLHCTPQWPR